MNRELFDYLNQYHTIINQQSKGALDVTKNVFSAFVDEGINDYLDAGNKISKSKTIVAICVGDKSKAFELIREKNYKELVGFFDFVCSDDSKVKVLLNTNKNALQSAMDIIISDYFCYKGFKDFESNIEKLIISKRQKEISSKRKKHRFYDEAIRKATITWQHFPTISYARMAKALDSYFGEGVSREAIEGWLKDAALRPEGPVRKTTFTLMG
ncbi:hypothetical protein OVA10_25370 [Lelliottia sp. SL45]|uniref:hypothetical protein n=1 Tax=Lelliottia sp. SL45 TaxID=2994665 RepID=UPI002275AC57|nr:hypothetical protein [Lelliottia sp. SL45]MCY1701330.1 hypothetical protein [Lelliottia sp. SL45]